MVKKYFVMILLFFVFKSECIYQRRGAGSPNNASVIDIDAESDSSAGKLVKEVLALADMDGATITFVEKNNARPIEESSKVVAVDTQQDILYAKFDLLYKLGRIKHSSLCSKPALAAATVGVFCGISICAALVNSEPLSLIMFLPFFAWRSKYYYNNTLESVATQFAVEKLIQKNDYASIAAGWKFNSSVKKERERQGLSCHDVIKQQIDIVRSLRRKNAEEAYIQAIHSTPIMQSYNDFLKEKKCTIRCNEFCCLRL